MIARSDYIQQLRPFIDKPQIKIITGIRRSGKSTVLHLLKDELLNNGVQEEQIISINFESFDNIDLLMATNLYRDIKSKIKTSAKYYLLLDEIQEVENWEKAKLTLLPKSRAIKYISRLLIN